MLYTCTIRTVLANGSDLRIKHSYNRSNSDIYKTYLIYRDPDWPGRNDVVQKLLYGRIVTMLHSAL